MFPIIDGLRRSAAPSNIVSVSVQIKIDRPVRKYADTAFPADSHPRVLLTMRADKDSKVLGWDPASSSEAGRAREDIRGNKVQRPSKVSPSQ